MFLDLAKNKVDLPVKRIKKFRQNSESINFVFVNAIIGGNWQQNRLIF